MKKRVRIVVLVEAAQAVAVKKAAKAAGISVGEYIRRRLALK